VNFAELQFGDGWHGVAERQGGVAAGILGPSRATLESGHGGQDSDLDVGE
jgi:hypothetical protein